MPPLKIKAKEWDAELDTDGCSATENANLTLILKLALRQINPAGGAAEGTHHDYGDPADTARKTVKWDAGTWANWTKDFVDTAQEFWNGKFWLLNNFPVLEVVKGGVTFRPNIYCKLKIKLARLAPAGAGEAHATIDVVRLHHTENWFGSHSTLYDNLDSQSVQKGTDSAGHPIMQRAHVHEIGHLLGLGHIDIGKPHCPVAGNTNAGACYGMQDKDKKTVMGQGMALRKIFANPWRRAIVKLTKKGMAGTHTDWAARMHRIYPRTPDEVLANREVTVRTHHAHL